MPKLPPQGLRVTQAGDLRDHVLEASDVFRTTGRGVVVVWALREGAVTLEAA